jgi:hypothetical protein
MMGGVTTQNMWSSLQKYNKLYIVASCWSIIGIKLMILVTLPNGQMFATSYGFCKLAGLKETLHQISNLLGTMKKEVNVYLSSLMMKVPDHVYVLG